MRKVEIGVGFSSGEAHGDKIGDTVQSVEGIVLPVMRSRIEAGGLKAPADGEALSGASGDGEG